jgi:hypothetical protein
MRHETGATKRAEEKSKASLAAVSNVRTMQLWLNAARLICLQSANLPLSKFVPLP